MFLVELANYAWHETSSIWNEKKGRLFSIRMRLASSVDDPSWSREDAECFISYKNRTEYTLHG